MKDIEKIKIVDFDMPFQSMIKFILKWSIASIPTLIIWFLIVSAVIKTINAIINQ